MIPKRFQCMGFTVPVEFQETKKGVDGYYHGREPRISISKDATPAVQNQTFWHEFMHCALTNLGYEDLNDNEQFVDQMAGLLYQLEVTRVERKK